MEFEADRKEVGKSILDVTSRLYPKMNTTLSGNISGRVSGNRMLITPSGLDKMRITIDKLSLMDIDLEKLVEGPKQSSEYHVHTRIYQAMKDVNAIVHPHAPYSIALVGALGAKRVIDEVAENDEEYDYYVTSVASVGKMKMGTVEIGDAVAKAVKNGAKVVVMENHGTVGVGETFQKALDRVEYFEYMVKKMHIRNMEKLYLESTEGKR